MPLRRLRELQGLGPAVGCALALGALSTLGDLIWALYIPSHQVVYGLAHGAILFLALGVVLGLTVAPGKARAALRGALAQLGVGLVVTGGFYLLYRPLGIASMFVSWMAFWPLTSQVYRWLHGSTDTIRSALVRGLVAAVLSGLAFYSISGIWLEPDPGGANYAEFFAKWTFAFLPGFLALMLRRVPVSE